MVTPRLPTDRSVGSAAAVAIVLGIGTLAPPASAAPKIQGVAETSIGYTDNTQSAPDVPLPGGTPRSGGVFVLLSPGVVLAAVTQRTSQRLKYTYTYDLFLQSTNASTSSNRLKYRAFFDLSPRVRLTVGAAPIHSTQ